MIEFLSFVAVWLGIMALIGIALHFVAKMSRKKTEENKQKDTQDIADE